MKLDERSAIVATLEAFCLKAGWRITDELAEDVGGEHTLELCHDLMGGYIIRVRSKWFAEKRDIAVPRPATWWDHFKRDAIPTFTRWFHLDVMYAPHIIKAATIYPDNPYIAGRRFHFAEVVTAQLEPANPYFDEAAEDVGE